MKNHRPSIQWQLKLPDDHIVPLSKLKHWSELDRELVKTCLPKINSEENHLNLGLPESANPNPKIITIDYNPNNPLGLSELIPGINSPICQKCQFYQNGCRHPFMAPAGSANPKLTIIFEGVTKAEDAAGKLAASDSPAILKKILEENSDKTGINPGDIRWLPLTRCANYTGINIATKARFCRYFAVADLLRHRPKAILVIGSTALKFFTLKNSITEWAGHTLRYRGWPDDWIIDPNLRIPVQKDGEDIGHPIFGKIPTWEALLLPIASPKAIFAANNPKLHARWIESILNAAKKSTEKNSTPNIVLPWYRWLEEPHLVIAALSEIPDGTPVAFDTETTGLRPWSENAAIVSFMFRWQTPDGKPKCFGFPWDYDGSPLKNHLESLKPVIWNTLTRIKLIGHNLNFDLQYVFTTFWRDLFFDQKNRAKELNEKLHQLTSAAFNDTWHLAFVLQQRPGKLGLEKLASDYVPELAGYEEPLTLLIKRNPEKLDPEYGANGHYLNCPKNLWKTHLIPYVLGDVEVTYRAWQRLREKLDLTKRYKIPLADPRAPGKFRLFTPPSRKWVYDYIMAPASRTLTALMTRGLHVHIDRITELEIVMPKRIAAIRQSLRETSPKAAAWYDTRKATIPGWELDLEDKQQLKELLFDCLGLPIMRLTKQGRELFGDDIQSAKETLRRALLETSPELAKDTLALKTRVNQELKKYAAVDKFTLYKLCATFKALEPLQEYRKLYKLYTTYVRPLRNAFNRETDKKERTQPGHLCPDHCIHPQFLMTGTRGGRLSCHNPNVQQIPRDGEIKTMFTSRFGDRGCLYQADMSQIELRLMAAASGDPTMLKAYFDEIDLHSLTTSRIFRVPYEHFSKDHMKELQKMGKDKEAKVLEEKRLIGKCVNFLTGYGGGAYGLQNVLAMRGINRSFEECKQIIDMFFESYPALRTFIALYKRFILNEKVAVSIFGRVRVFEELFGHDEELIAKAIRSGCNHLIQATASDMMLTALFVIEELMRAEGMEAMLVSTVHDSILIDCPRHELPAIHQHVETVLNNLPDIFKLTFGDDYDTSWMTVPFKGDMELGNNYLNMHKIEKNPNWDELFERLDAAKNSHA
jgi:DNA polymerase I-like protein with 3'-5' exonuclease and polymerase domains/uracil-DNA glycosylase